MGMVISNNVASLTAQHNLNKTSQAMNKSLERLSSGLKINRGADGPAALVISEQQRSQIAGLNQAIENAGKAVSMVQTAEGALNEMNSLLTKARGLTLDSANAGVNDDEALKANQAEIGNILNTIDRIANNTQFGTKKLLQGDAASTATATSNAANVDFTVSGSVTEGTHTVTNVTAATAANVKGSAAASLAAGTTENVTINGYQFTVTGKTGGSDAADLASQINNYSDKTGVKAQDDGSGKLQLYSESFGSNHQFTFSVQTGSGTGLDGQSVTDGTDIKGKIDGVDATGSGNTLSATTGSAAGLSVTFKATAADKTTTDATDTNLKVDTSKALLFQIGANAGQTAQISVDDMRTTAIGKNSGTNQFSSLSDINITDPKKAGDALKVIDKAIKDVTNLRGTLGAFQSNTLESTTNNLRATLENTTAAESTIRDTDFAAEMSNFTKQQTLMQAGVSMLQNANQSNQMVLSLLRG